MSEVKTVDPKGSPMETFSGRVKKLFGQKHVLPDGRTIQAAEIERNDLPEDKSRDVTCRHVVVDVLD